jgi:hypothetical protein
VTILAEFSTERSRKVHPCGETSDVDISIGDMTDDLCTDPIPGPERTRKKAAFPMECRPFKPLQGAIDLVAIDLVEGVDLSRLVAGDFHADAHFLNDGGRPRHDVSPGW